MAAGRPRVALAHDYLTQRGGAERVVLAMTRAFPEATLHTLLYEPGKTFAEFADVDLRVSPLNHASYLRRHHRRALPALPFAASAMRIDADVVIASSSGWAHGIRSPGAKIVYCYSPARWLYQSDRYLGAQPSLVRSTALRTLRPGLIRWDQHAAGTATRYLAISTAVQQRIADTYGLASEVVPAPVTLSRAEPEELREPATRALLEAEPFHLVVSRLLPYKNVDVVVRAFERLPGDRLVVVGTGPELQYLRSVSGPNVTFLAGLTDGEMHWLYAHARSLVAASHEDYGLTPLEAALHGTPAVVLRWGGFLDTMVEGATAVFFDDPEPAAVADAVRRADDLPWDAGVVRANAERFSEEHFAERLQAEVAAVLARPGTPGH
ncbi:glycosyltransferase [Nocardioides taihuensis]|uniref:Glycosyltransferase n=1 Tax=Nocardioides taihuensis TaxID=1835606 RepID=A0ABW0BEL0_9ACTN